jgi:hypothetical protein
MLRQKRPSFDLHEQDIIAKYMNNTERVADLLPSRPYKEIKLELHKLVKRYASLQGPKVCRFNFNENDFQISTSK